MNATVRNQMDDDLLRILEVLNIQLNAIEGKLGNVAQELRGILQVKRKFGLSLNKSKYSSLAHISLLL